MAEREGQALVEYDELPAAGQLESAVEKLAMAMSIHKSGVVGRRQSRSSKR